MTDDTNTAERDSFEAWYISKTRDSLPSSGDGWSNDQIRDSFMGLSGNAQYRSSSAQLSWDAWQARASLAASAGSSEGSELVTFELPPTSFEPFAQGVEIGYDLWGGADIRLGGEFVYVHINYDYRYTHNAARRSLAEQIAGIIAGTLFTHPFPPEGMAGWISLSEQQPEDGVLKLFCNMKAESLAATFFVDWMVGGKFCGNRHNSATHYQELPPLPASEAKEL